MSSRVKSPIGLPKGVHHGELVLRRSEQRVDGLIQRRVDGNRREARFHRLADRQPLERLLRRAHPRLARGDDVDKDRR